MSTNYNAKKKPELEALLKERGLPHTGNKADLVTRLQEDDAKNGDADASTMAAASVPAPPPDEDQIDWDEGDAGAAGNGQAGARAATNPASQAALAAGGQGQVPNPVAVPNQVLDAEADPAKADDLKVVGQPGTAATGDADGTNKPTSEELEAKKAAEEEKFRAGLAASTADAEAEKRKKRAERFGIKSGAEEQKAADRAKRFGTVDEGAQKSVALLDSALPERRERKRGRDRADEGRRGNKRVDSRKREQRPNINDADRAAAQRRLERFGGKPAAASN